MSTELVPLAVLMGLATYPWRGVPLLAPGMHSLPATIQLYLRLVGPATLATLATVSIMVTLDSARHPSFHVGWEWLAVALSITIVAVRKNLFVALVLAAGLMAALRAAGIAALP